MPVDGLTMNPKGVLETDDLVDTPAPEERHEPAEAEESRTTVYGPVPPSQLAVSVLL